MHCLLKWLGTAASKGQCPMDRREWGAFFSFLIPDVFLNYLFSSQRTQNVDHCMCNVQEEEEEESRTFVVRIRKSDTSPPSPPLPDAYCLLVRCSTALFTRPDRLRSSTFDLDFKILRSGFIGVNPKS